MIGVVLFAIKYGLDHTVSVYGFGRSWSPLDYLNLPNMGAITALGRDDLVYCVAMVAVEEATLLSGSLKYVAS